MNWFYPWLATATALTLAVGRSDPQEHPLPRPSPAPIVTTAAASGTFSKHALRQAQLILQMRLLELREARLERVRAAILRRLPPDVCARI